METTSLKYDCYKHFSRVFKLKKGEVLLSILKLSKKMETFSKKELLTLIQTSENKASEYIENLIGKNFLSKENEFLTVSPDQKIMLVIEALNQGLPIDIVCRYISWKDFELTVKNILEFMGYKTLTRQRLKINKKIFEVDILAFHEDIILCIDCKQWKRGLGASTINHMVKKQLKRAEAVAKNLKKIKESLGERIKEKEVKILPLIITLAESSYKVYDKVPIVPILKLKSFLEGFYGCLKNFNVLYVNNP